MSPVITWRFDSFLDLAWESMYSFCVLELEKAVIWELGKISARYRHSEPHPHLQLGQSPARQTIS